MIYKMYIKENLPYSLDLSGWNLSLVWMAENDYKFFQSKEFIKGFRYDLYSWRKNDSNLYSVSAAYRKEH
jgi:hypothetical protein